MLKSFRCGLPPPDSVEAVHFRLKNLHIGRLILVYFCESFNLNLWEAGREKVEDRMRFVSGVSVCFANRLAKLGVKLKRKEFKHPDQQTGLVEYYGPQRLGSSFSEAV